MGDDDLVKKYLSNIRQLDSAGAETMKVNGLTANNEGKHAEALEAYEAAYKNIRKTRHSSKIL